MFGRRVLRSALVALATCPVLLLAMRLSFHGPVPWFYDWPCVLAMLVVGLVAIHVVGRLDRPEGATRPHWADSAILHEAEEALNRDLDAKPRPSSPALSDGEVAARLQDLSRRPDQDGAIAESEALLRRQFDQRLAPVFEADRRRRRRQRARTRIAHMVITLLMGAGLGLMLYVAYF